MVFQFDLAGRAKRAWGSTGLDMPDVERQSCQTAPEGDQSCLGSRTVPVTKVLGSNLDKWVVLCCAVACAVAKPGIGAPLAYSGLGPLGYGLGGIAPYSAGHIAYSGLASPLAYSGLASPLAYSGLASPLCLASPLAYSGLAAPVAYAAAAPAVAVGVRTQYHAQDELGQASYGHAEPFQTHNAVQDAHGNKIGSYSYVAPDGQVIKTDYVADGAGYRVASNALPVGPSILPAPVHDTPEVVAARAAHLAEVAAVHSRSKRGIALGHLPASTRPLAVAAPLAYAALRV
uniref:Cuticle protein 7 n=1 Tax=Timema shepardi TaxID=629360 RepID=A0A7R9G0C9_TIMSH|nr:unnamed protein product [Timema shepardi]